VTCGTGQYHDRKRSQAAAERELIERTTADQGEAFLSNKAPEKKIEKAVEGKA